MNRVYIPAREPEPVWPNVDEIGELIAAVVIFAMVALVGWASCWEVVQ